MNQSEAHETLSDEAFAERFKHCSLGDIAFTHRAHLRLAWIYIEKYGEALAITKISQQLKAYTRSVGAEEKYNHTVTVAAIKAVRHHMDKSASNSFTDFIAAFPELELNFRGLIGSHYSFDVFNHPKAKLIFLEPDVSPF